MLEHIWVREEEIIDIISILDKPTPIHTIRLTVKVDSKGPSQDILNTLSE